MNPLVLEEQLLVQVKDQSTAWQRLELTLQPWAKLRAMLSQLGHDHIGSQLSHQFNLKNVRGNDFGVASLACVGIDEN